MPAYQSSLTFPPPLSQLAETNTCGRPAWEGGGWRVVVVNRKEVARKHGIRKADEARDGSEKGKEWEKRDMGEMGEMGGSGDRG
jgi:hypothetical protein